MKGDQRGGRGVWEREGGREGWSGEGSDSWTERWKEGRLATTRVRNKEQGVRGGTRGRGGGAMPRSHRIQFGPY